MSSAMSYDDPPACCFATASNSTYSFTPSVYNRPPSDNPIVGPENATTPSTRIISGLEMARPTENMAAYYDNTVIPSYTLNGRPCFYPQASGLAAQGGHNDEKTATTPSTRIISGLETARLTENTAAYYDNTVIPSYTLNGSPCFYPQASALGGQGGHNDQQTQYNDKSLQDQITADAAIAKALVDSELQTLFEHNLEKATYESLQDQQLRSNQHTADGQLAASDRSISNKTNEKPAEYRPGGPGSLQDQQLRSNQHTTNGEFASSDRSISNKTNEKPAAPDGPGSLQDQQLRSNQPTADGEFAACGQPTNENPAEYRPDSPRSLQDQQLLRNQPTADGEFAASDRSISNKTNEKPVDYPPDGPGSLQDQFPADGVMAKALAASNWQTLFEYNLEKATDEPLIASETPFVSKPDAETVINKWYRLYTKIWHRFAAGEPRQKRAFGIKCAAAMYNMGVVFVPDTCSATIQAERGVTEYLTLMYNYAHMGQYETAIWSMSRLCGDNDN